MHGPYTTQIRARSGETLVQLTEDELRASGGVETAHRFYADGGGVEGTLRAGVFASADLLAAGDEVEIIVLGYEGSHSREREIECRRARARRDDRGRFVSTLGSRFNERVFIGV